MRKFRFFLDFAKEEKWLEEMAAKGWKLKKIGFRYTFEAAPPEKVTIKIDYLQPNKNNDLTEYITLFEDSGWQHIVGLNTGGNQYFMKKDENGSEDIFSDEQSRAGRYKKLSHFLFFLLAVMSPYVFRILIIEGIPVNIEKILNFKDLYKTQGLWEMVGFDFWKNFLLETPIALFQGFSWIVILLGFSLFLSITICVRIQYKKTLKN